MIPCRALLFLAVMFHLTGCGPMYRTFTFYDPPAGKQGKNCVFQCDQQRANCQSDCQINYDGCVQEAEFQGKRDYLNAKEDWLDKREHCLSKLKAQVKGESVCGDADEPRSHSYVSTAHCREDCGCDTDFERCFQLCGGHIRYEQRCVSGCEAVQQ